MQLQTYDYVTLGLVYITFRMAREQANILRTNLNVRLQLTFIDRFDDSVIQRHREVLAGKLLDGAPHEDIQEDLMNFFQDMGLFLERNHLDEYLV